MAMAMLQERDAFLMIGIKYLAVLILEHRTICSSDENRIYASPGFVAKVNLLLVHVARVATDI